ncbi:MAG: COX15/CtaA family protein [Sulfuritalea sp.]|nr:COX15/CtaA family protein [Sulfuritalea sp.]
METHGDRLKGIRSLALLLTALTFVLVLVSAYIRLSGAGLGCSGWPDCYGHILAGGPHLHTGAVRIIHRTAASAALLLGFMVAWRCLRPQPIQPVARYATLLVALMILLTFVGLWSSDPQRVWTSFLNMLGGVALVALSWRMVLAAGTDSTRAKSPSCVFLPHAGLAALALAIALGALIGARYAAISCTSVPACGDVWWPAVEGWHALNPFATVATPAAPGEAGGVTLHLLHRACAVAALLLLGMAGLQALANAATRSTGAMLLVLLVIEFALGSLTVVGGFSLWLAIGHSVCAAALLAVGMQLPAQAKAG